MKEKTRIALIGSGRAGMIHARNITYHVKNAEIVWLSDVEEENAKKAAEELGCAYDTDFRAVIAKTDVDAVIVAAPTKYHKEIVVEAARCKKHIFCEKPMAMDVEECREMIKAAEENNVLLQIGFMRRFDESFQRAKEIIESGKIGNVVMVKSLTHGPSTPHEWMYDIAKSNGPLAEVNSHDIDTLRWFTGSEVKSVYAIADNFRCKDAKEAYPDFYDSVLMSVRMENGMLGCIDGAQGVQYGYDARVDVVGTKGLITIGDLRDRTTVTYTIEGAESDVVRSWMNLFTEAYIKEDRSFVESIQKKEKPIVTGWDGLMAVAVVRAGNLSIQSGEVVFPEEK